MGKVKKEKITLLTLEGSNALIELLQKWVNSDTINASATLAAQSVWENKTPKPLDHRSQCWERGIEFLYKWICRTDEKTPNRDVCLHLIDRLQWDDICIRFDKELIQDDDITRFSTCLSSMITFYRAQQRNVLDHAEKDALRNEEALLREIDDEIDKKSKKKKSSAKKKNKKMQLEEDEKEEVLENALRRTPSPTRSPTIRSGKRSLLDSSTPPLLD